MDREIGIMKSVNHPNIIKILHHHRDYKNNFWVLLEFCDLGDLDQYCVKNNPDDPEINDFMKQTARAIKLLHENGIVHGNIKPPNILLKTSQESQFPVIKITDYGFQKIIDRHDIRKSPFTAPELYDPSVKCDKSSDIFSLGLTFFSVISFNNRREALIPSDDSSSTTIGNQMFVLSKIDEIERARRYHKEKVAICGTQMERRRRELIQRMICFEKTERLSIDEVVDLLEEKSKIHSHLQVTIDKNDFGHRLNMDFGKPQDNIKSVTTLKYDRIIQAVRSDSRHLACAATVKSWNKSAMTVNTWRVADHKDQLWKDHNLVVNDTEDLKNSPMFCEVITILENMFLLLMRNRSDDDYLTSQVLAVDSSSGNVLHKSQGFSSYCCYKSQILLTETSSSSITQLDEESLDLLNTWTDERVREPWRVCSNKNRAAVDDKHEYISVFKWEDEHLSHEKIYIVEFEYCEGIYLLQDDTHGNQYV